MNPSTQGPTIEQLQKVRKIRTVSNAKQGLGVHFSAHSDLSLLLVFPY